MCGVFSALMLPCFGQGNSISVPSENSSLAFSFGQPDRLEWFVDGRRILVYRSSPSTMINGGHHYHSGGHVGGNQFHMQGAVSGYENSSETMDLTGSVTGGIVYSVVGGPAGSGVSRLYETVQILNRSSSPVPLTLLGMGWRPSWGETPDLNGLDVSGTTVAVVHGNGYRDPQGVAHAGALVDRPPSGYGYRQIPSNAEPGFASYTAFPAHNFSGFNNFSQALELAPGATLTMYTELTLRSPSTSARVVEGESFKTSHGVVVEAAHLASLDNGDWAGYSQVDFGTGASVFEALVAVDPAYANQKLEIRLGAPNGTKIGELLMQSTGGFQNFQWQIANLSQTMSGVHDLYLVAVGQYGVGNVDKFRFLFIPR